MVAACCSSAASVGLSFARVTERPDASASVSAPSRASAATTFSFAALSDVLGALHFRQHLVLVAFERHDVVASAEGVDLRAPSRDVRAQLARLVLGFCDGRRRAAAVALGEARPVVGDEPFDEDRQEGRLGAARLHGDDVGLADLLHRQHRLQRCRRIAGQQHGGRRRRLPERVPHLAEQCRAGQVLHLVAQRIRLDARAGRIVGGLPRAGHEVQAGRRLIDRRSRVHVDQPDQRHHEEHRDEHEQTPPVRAATLPMRFGGTVSIPVLQEHFAGHAAGPR